SYLIPNPEISRLPPGEPADLFRASLVCKLWLRIASDPAFLRHYRAFHRGAPLLGFFYSVGCPSYSPLFIPTTTAAPPLRRPVYDDHHWLVLDCRHGRILLRNLDLDFSVWDPITGSREELSPLKFWYTFCSAAVLCAMAGCDHRDCHGVWKSGSGVGNDDAAKAIRSSVYSLEARAWGTPDSANFEGRCPFIFDINRAALIGDEIYYVVDLGARILKYDLVKRSLSMIDLPDSMYCEKVLMQNEDGSLGLACLCGSRLHLWSRMVNPEGVTGWVQRRVFELKILPKANAFGFAEGAGGFCMSTKAGAFTIELKSGHVRKAGESRYYCAFFPFISFFTPGTAPALLVYNPVLY
ncbi:hypothetical protein PVAP13_2KG186332, partial [Panicum virgatum]